MASTTHCWMGAFSSISSTKTTLVHLFSKYSALILPNTALLSDSQCAHLKAFVDNGGSLLATFETSMYNERNERRPDFGLADVFGIHRAGDIIGTNGNAFYARIERKHPILEGFDNTNWLPGAEYAFPSSPYRSQS